MDTPVAVAISRLLSDEPVDEEQMYAAMHSVMAGEVQPAALAAMLTALQIRGESPEVIAGAARAMAEQATPIRPQRSGLLDTCGTGGSGLPAFNISTAAAFVAAAAGVPVAKHGNRAATSRSGSADVLEALGVNVDCDVATVEKCIDDVGIGFLYARTLHAAMKHAAPVRQALGFRTLFNLLGPLTNPAGAEFQLLGTTRNATVRKLAAALFRLGRKRAYVVCGGDEFDEICLWDDNLVCLVEPSGVREEIWSPEDFGLARCLPAEVFVNSPRESAECLRAVFSGASGPARNIVVANAAAALRLTERVATLRAGVSLAEQQLDTGAARETLTHLISTSAS